MMEPYGKCFCPICERELDGRVVVDREVWLVRNCPDHGRMRTMLYCSPDFLAAAMKIAEPTVRSDRHSCHVAEITEKCDVGCATCSASSVLAGAEPNAKTIVSRALRRARMTGSQTIALSGGEPLMRSDLWEIVDALHAEVPKIVVITSGRGFETDSSILQGFAERSEWLEIYLQFDSLDDDVLLKLRGPVFTGEMRRNRLQLAVASGAQTTAVCVTPSDCADDTVSGLAAFCRDAGATGITFQPLRQLGRHPGIYVEGSKMGTIDHIQRCALRGLGVEDCQPTPFAQQPFDITVTFVGGGLPQTQSRFFLDRPVEKLFRVATSSYWDMTNYFAPFAKSGLHFFYSSSGQPLNARYFKPPAVPKSEGRVVTPDS